MKEHNAKVLIAHSNKYGGICQFFKELLLEAGYFPIIVEKMPNRGKAWDPNEKINYWLEQSDATLVLFTPDDKVGQEWHPRQNVIDEYSRTVSRNKPVIVLKAPNTRLPTNINPIYGPLNFKKLRESTIYVLKELRKLCEATDPKPEVRIELSGLSKVIQAFSELLSTESKAWLDGIIVYNYRISITHSPLGDSPDYILIRQNRRFTSIPPSRKKVIMPIESRLKTPKVLGKTPEELFPFHEIKINGKRVETKVVFEIPSEEWVVRKCSASIELTEPTEVQITDERISPVDDPYSFICERPTRNMIIDFVPLKGFRPIIRFFGLREKDPGLGFRKEVQIEDSDPSLLSAVFHGWMLPTHGFALSWSPKKTGDWSRGP